MELDQRSTGQEMILSTGADQSPQENECIRLGRWTGMRYALLVPILEELAREGRIRITGEIRSLI